MFSAEVSVDEKAGDGVSGAESEDESPGLGDESEEVEVLHSGEGIDDLAEALLEDLHALLEGRGVALDGFDGAIEGEASPRVEGGGILFVFDDHDTGGLGGAEITGMFGEGADVDIEVAVVVADKGRVAGIGPALGIDGGEDKGFGFIEEGLEILLLLLGGLEGGDGFSGIGCVHDGVGCCVWIKGKGASGWERRWAWTW